MPAAVVLLTFKEACEQLRKSEAQGRWMLSRGDFPRAAKIGGRLMVRASDLSAYLAEKFGDVA